MAGSANTPRKATAKLLSTHIIALKQASGILVKTTRAFKSSTSPAGQTQGNIASAAQTNQPAISDFENGGTIPSDTTLDIILNEVGFDLNKPGGLAFAGLLKYIRDNESNLSQLEDELPE